MAAVATVTENATELMGKLALDTKSKPHAAPDNTKKTGLNQPYERSLTPLLQEYMDSNNMCYMPTGYPSTTYYYDGYNGSGNEWENYSRYVTAEGVEMPPPGHYEDMYHQGYGYAPYGVYPSPGSPVPTMGHDGQIYGPQHYQYPATYYQPSTTAVTQYAPNLAPQGEVSTSAAPVHPTISVETAKPKQNEIPNGNPNGNSGPAPPKPGQHNPSLSSNGLYGRGVLSTGHLSSNYHDPRYTFDGVRSPVPWFDGSVLGNGQYRQGNTGAISSPVSHTNNSSCARSPNLRPLQHGTGVRTARPTSGVAPTSPGIMNRMYPNNQMYTQYGNAYRTGLGIGPNFYDPRAIGRWGIAVDNKYRPRGRGNGLYGYNNENLDGLSELNRGPRAGRFKTSKAAEPTVTGPTVTVGDKDHSAIPDKDQYNRADFVENFPDAKFFIIKSYSEDDLHKSIKYNVWASTPNGNIKLDAAYKEAQQKPVACPVFLFFSVNTSGQFVGAAEMVGPVDFDKTVNYWQQDKWTGCFPVKWHIVKDVPNNLLKHITLENNDNKPVTNSRDTQEVKLDQGLQMLKLFKEHVSRTSILEDFHFYETRQKAMQEKRAKQQHLQRQIVEVKAIIAVDENDKDGATGKPRLQKPLEKVTVAKKEPVQVGLSERKASDENTVAVVAGNPPKVSKPVVPEKRILTNGVANGC